MTTNNDSFQFQLLQRDIFKEIPKENFEFLEKWGMIGRMKFKSFSYNKHFQLYEKKSFMEDFFANEVVNANLEVLTSMDEWKPLSTFFSGQSISNVSIRDVPATQLSMSFFDRLTSSGVVRESGHIVKCFDETMDDFLISDELKKMFLLEESEHYSLYSDDEKKEFLFKILQHLVLGGPVNQYEDIVEPYLNTAKLLYKLLLLVVKDINTKHLSIASHVLDVKAKVGDSLVFPSKKEHIQSFCYVIIDNVKRHVTLWYHVWS